MPSCSLCLLVLVGGGGISALNLSLWLQANGRIVLQYVYKCFKSLDRQLWNIIYCTCAGYYMESLASFFLGI